jgi:hypothetical protein
MCRNLSFSVGGLFPYLPLLLPFVLGHYMYTPATLKQSGDVFRLLTREFPVSLSALCLQFYYNMNGATDMGTLSVKVKLTSI